MNSTTTVASIIGMVMATGAAMSQPVQMLGTLGGTSSVANDINDNGVVCGYSTTAGNAGIEATVWSGGSASSLGVPGLYSFTYANAINNAGDVAGYAETGTVPGDFTNMKTAFYWGHDGVNANIGTGLGTGTFSIAYDINDAGTVVGQGEPVVNRTRGFVWNQQFGGQFEGGDSIYNFGANFGTNAGNDLVGYAAAGFDGGQPIFAPFDPIAGGWSNGLEIGVQAVRDPQSANAISDNGIIVGQAGDGRDHVFEAVRFTLDRNEPVVWLGTIDGFEDSNARDVNDSGIIVGSGYDFEPVVRRHAIAWVNDVAMDLNDLIAGNPDWDYLEEATGINARGDIVGYGVTSGGDVRGFLIEGFGGPACPADANGDGVLTPADFNAWILAFNSGSAACDQNGDGNCLPNDFSAWITNFNAGC